MIRRDFFKTPLAVAGLTLGGTSEPAAAPELAKAPGLTRYVSEFIVNTRYEDIPEDVLVLGKKTLLDGFGLALAGSASVLGPRIRRYIASLGFANGKAASIIGTFNSAVVNRGTWITDPSSFKPGTKMPSHNFPPEQMAGLVAWLETLK